MKIRASAPARVDLAGGTLDIWPLYLLVQGAVTVNAAISLRARVVVGGSESTEHVLTAEDLDRSVTLRVESPPVPPGSPLALGPLPLHEAVVRHLGPVRPLRITTSSEVPAGSGLGGSSSLAVCLIAAVSAHEGRPYDPSSLAAAARDLEAQVIQAPTGTQDHLAALHGGISVIRHAPGPPVREALPVDAAALEACGVLAYLGASRASARANWDMIRRALDGEAPTRSGLSAVASIASRMETALASGKIEECGRLLDAEWQERRGLSPEVTTEETERAMAAARRAGAIGAKICGAGGGGCLFVIGPPEARDRIEEALRSLGCRPLPFTVEPRGLRVEQEVGEG